MVIVTFYNMVLLISNSAWSSVLKFFISLVNFTVKSFIRSSGTNKFPSHRFSTKERVCTENVNADTCSGSFQLSTYGGAFYKIVSS